MAPPQDGARLTIALSYVRMAIWLILGVGLLVASVILFLGGQPSGVAAVVFGAIFTGFGIFRIWLTARLRRAAGGAETVVPADSE